MVWSSATQNNVDKMCHIFTKPLKLVWSRNHFNLSARQFYSNVETVKDLEMVWTHFSGEFDASNTIIVDDSTSKLVRQPFNLIHVRTFHHADIDEGYTDNELLKVIDYLDTIRSHSNVANYVRNKPFLSHKYVVPENKELDSAMQHFTGTGRFVKPQQPLKMGIKRRLDDDDDGYNGIGVDVSIEQVKLAEDGVNTKPEPAVVHDNSISIKLEADDGTAGARQQDDEVEKPPRKKSKKAKKEKTPKPKRKTRRSKKQKKAATTSSDIHASPQTEVKQKKKKKKKATSSNIPIRPQTEKKLKSIQESIKQKKQEQKKHKKSNSSKIELQAVKIEPC